jgi:predicted N-acetyltransferase YhbS
MSAPTIRRENPADIDAIHGINAAAFESSAEARLVDRLRTEARPRIELSRGLAYSCPRRVRNRPVRLD